MDTSEWGLLDWGLYLWVLIALFCLLFGVRYIDKPRKPRNKCEQPGNDLDEHERVQQ